VPAAIHSQRESESSIQALAALRARIAKIEGHAPGLSSDARVEAWTSGLAAMDAALGAGEKGLGLGALHEIVAASPVDLPVASAFAFGLLARLKRRGPLLWCVTGLTQNEYGAPYAPGLAAFGIDPSRIVSINVRHPRDLSFVLEEAARLPGLAAIIAEGPLPSFTASRRLALLLATSGVPMLFLPDGKTGQGSAAATRFVVAPLVAPNSALDIRSPGPPAFRVTLARTRGGRPGLSFEMVFDHANLTFAPYLGTALSRAQFDSLPDRQFSVASAPERQRSA
jgi:protein ImuA